MGSLAVYYEIQHNMCWSFSHLHLTDFPLLKCSISVQDIFPGFSAICPPWHLLFGGIFKQHFVSQWMNEEIYSVKSRALINSSECSKYLGQNLLQILNLQKSKNVYSALYSLIGWNLKMFTMHCTVYSILWQDGI